MPDKNPNSTVNHGKYGTRGVMYDNLVADGYDFGGYSEYTKALDTKEGRRNMYDNLVADGYELGSYEEFHKMMNADPNYAANAAIARHRGGGRQGNERQGNASAHRTRQTGRGRPDTADGTEET